MESMKKYWSKGTHFGLVSGKQLENKTVDVVQIWPEKVYVNNENYAVFIAEIVDEESEE